MRRVRWERVLAGIGRVTAGVDRDQRRTGKDLGKAGQCKG